MDFLKQTNFRYIVIIIIIILAVINLYKINSQENFMILTEDQDLGTHNVMIDNTDQVKFGNETLTHKLTNLDTLTVAGYANFPGGAFVKGELHSTNNTPEGGRISLMNSLKTATGEVDNWTIYNMTGGYLPNGLHFWKYPMNAWEDSGSTLVLTDEGDTLVKGELTVEKNTLVKGDLTFETDGPDGSTGGGISIINTEKTDNNQAQKWTIYNFNNYNNSNGLSFWRYSNLGCTQEGMCAEHMTMNDDGTTVFKGGLTVDGSTLVRGNLTVDGIANGNAFINSSDRRLKENIENISQNDKDKVLQLVPKTYNMISDQNKKRYGLIAQEVEELYPELVNTNETDGMKSLNYIELIPLLLEQIKELKKSVEQIKTLINM